ncbi:ABC transporter permease [Fischerella sp. PCC 9605]|uniref:ABC transporter permease n=1 Tax=Fischerella sp. PCC 9605 TaxID=1173024 RepID=UPI00047DFB53|nr:ABC transporter permease [Fischerella sp. PCC 9605]
MLPKRNPPSVLVQLLDLFLMELTNWRWSWRILALNSAIAPMLGIIALGSFAQGSQQPNLAYILTGNLVMALMFGNLNNIASRFSYMRFAGTLEYYATLPISRTALIIASVLAFFLLSLPSLLVNIIFGIFFLKIPLILNPLILLIIPLCVLPLAGLGALIGANARTPQESDSLSLLVTMGMLFIGSVLIPENRLPNFLLGLGKLSPATYAASALRQTLIGPVTGQVVIDVAGLLGFTLLVFWLVGRRLDWRQR